MPNLAAAPSALVTTLLGALLLLVFLLVILAGWFLARQRLLAPTVATLAALLVVALLVRLRELVALILMATVLAFILDAPVQRLERRMPRWLAIVLVYLGFVGLAVGAGFLAVPQL